MLRGMHSDVKFRQSHTEQEKENTPVHVSFVSKRNCCSCCSRAADCRSVFARFYSAVLLVGINHMAVCDVLAHVLRSMNTRVLAKVRFC